MSLETMKTRLDFRGGANQQIRMGEDKLRGLRKALLYSYQAQTAVLDDGRAFRCLINSDKNKPAYDDKTLSIPFDDINIGEHKQGSQKTREGREKTGIKPGDTFLWKETNTHWLIYLRFIEQNAYFRASIRRCDQQVAINDKPYWVYIRGPVETDIEWTQKQQIEWNSLNYSLVMYITADENTNAYFERFKTVKVIDPRYNSERTWQVNGVDPYYGDGIIQVMLKEWYENPIQDEADKANKTREQASHIEHDDQTDVYIDGPTAVKQYSKNKFTIKNAKNGKWIIKFEDQEYKFDTSSNSINVSTPGKLGIFTLIYRRQNQDDVTLDVTIIPI